MSSPGTISVVVISAVCLLAVAMVTYYRGPRLAAGGSTRCAPAATAPQDTRPPATCLAEAGPLKGAPVATAGHMSLPDVAAADEDHQNHTSHRELREQVMRMQPDEAQANAFIAEKGLGDWAPGIRDIGDRISTANLHMDVLRRPVVDGLNNRSPIIPFWAPPPRQLPARSPCLVEQGFGISSRLANVYEPGCADDVSNDQYQCMNDGQFVVRDDGRYGTIDI